MRFATEYPAGAIGHIYAPDAESAQAIAQARGIDEQILCPWPAKGRGWEPHPRPSEEVSAAFGSGGCRLKAVHALVYLGYLAMSSGVCSVHDVLGDDGWLHATVHVLQGIVIGEPPLDEIRAVERAVPGFLPSTEGE